MCYIPDPYTDATILRETVKATEKMKVGRKTMGLMKAQSGRV